MEWQMMLAKGHKNYGKTMKEERKINSCHGALNLTKGRESFLK